MPSLIIGIIFATLALTWKEFQVTFAVFAVINILIGLVFIAKE